MSKKSTKRAKRPRRVLIYTRTSAKGAGQTLPKQRRRCAATVNEIFPDAALSHISHEGPSRSGKAKWLKGGHNVIAVADLTRLSRNHQDLIALRKRGVRVVVAT